MPVTKVLILNWNGSGHLRRFLPSVIRTTPDDIGIVVVDNGSTDDSVDVVRGEFPEVELLSFDDNYGYAGGYNRAVAALEADYFILLNSDVEPAEGWCGPLVAALDDNPEIIAVQPKIRSLQERSRFEYAGACGGFIDRFGYPFCRGRVFSTTETDDGQYDTFRYCFWASGACLACRREMFTTVGGLDEDFFAHMEEIDMCWRAQKFGWKIAVEPSSIVYHLGGGTLPVNSPRKVYLNFRNNLAMLYKNLPAGSRRWVIPVRMILDGVSACMFLFQGHGGLFRQVFAAHMDFYRWKKALRPKRAEIASRTVSEPEGVFYGSVVFRYFVMRRRRFSDICK